MSTVLGTALIKIRNKRGQFVTLRVFIDGGAMTSYVTIEAVKLLGCKTSDCYKEVSSVDGTFLHTITKETILELQNRKENLRDSYVFDGVSVVKRVPLILPGSLEVNLTAKVKKTLADPQFTVPAGIDILIGGHHWNIMKRQGFVRLGNVLLQNSILGRIAFGSAPMMVSADSHIVSTIVSSSDYKDVQRMFKRAFETEVVPEEEDEYAEMMFMQTHRRLPSGRYEVALLKRENVELGNSYNVCFQRNANVLRKLNEIQLQQFFKVMSDYQDAEIIELCGDKQAGFYYAPFVLVWRNKATTPLRVFLTDRNEVRMA